jgi:phage repressor protein C with HTH and peptisase S24 domain
METGWRLRLRNLIAERRLSMKELSLAAGLGETAVRDILERRGDPRISTLHAVAGAIGTSLAELYLGDEGTYQRIKVLGAVTDGEAWMPVVGSPTEIDVKVDGGEPIAVEVRGHSMFPAYRNGDLLIGSRQVVTHADNLIGLDCIVMTDTGERHVKILAKAAIRGRFNLRSYNPKHKDVENVKLAWAAPIVWIKRGQS